MSEYEPELGQAMFGARHERYAMPDYAEALFFGVWREISRVYWNVNQKAFGDRGEDDPRILGIVVRPYWWGDEDAPEAELPNFEAVGLRIHWYKYPGRGMSADRELTPEGWADWFDSVVAIVRDHDVRLPA